jgi:membrane protein
MIRAKDLTFFLTLLVIGFTPLDAIEIGEGVTLGRYFFILMTFSAIFTKDILLKPVPRFFKILIGFTIWASLTVLWSFRQTITLERIMYLIQYSIIVIVMLNSLDSKKKLKLAMISWILGVSYIAFNTALDYRTYAVAQDALYRVSEFGNPNENSFMLCYSLLFCYLIDTTKRRIFSICLTAFSVLAIVANGSRMGIIIFLLAIAGFCVQLWQSKKRIYVIALIPVIITGGVYVLEHIPEATFDRIMGMSQSIESGKFSERENIWAAAIEALAENKLWLFCGSGWGTFADCIKMYLGRSIGAHNFYLDVVFTTGVVGLSIIIYYFKILFKLIRKTYKADIINYLLLLIPLISMMSTNWQSRRWWFMMGAFIYLIYKHHNLKRIADVSKD